MLPMFGIQIPALLRDFHVFHMYKEHPVFNPPPSDAVLWRYMDFTKFVSLLEKQALFFARADRLGDPFEGSFSKVNKVLRPSFVQRLYGEEKIPEGTLEHMADHMERTRRSILINCWHQSTYESAKFYTISYWRNLENELPKTPKFRTISPITSIRVL